MYATIDFFWRGMSSNLAHSIEDYLALGGQPLPTWSHNEITPTGWQLQKFTQVFLAIRSISPIIGSIEYCQPLFIQHIQN